MPYRVKCTCPKLQTANFLRCGVVADDKELYGSNANKERQSAALVTT